MSCTGGLTNNGTIKTKSTVAATQEALVKLAGSGTVELLAAGAGTIGSAATVALGQNVVIGAEGKLVAPVAVVPFSGSKTITITSAIAKALDFGTAEITSIGATIVNNGTAADAINTDAATQVALQYILDNVNGKVTATGAITALAADFTVPADIELSTGASLTFNTGNTKVTVEGTWNAPNELTLAAVNAADAIVVSGTFTPGTGFNPQHVGALKTTGSGKVIASSAAILTAVLPKATATPDAALTVEVGTIAAAATGTIKAGTTVVVPNAVTLTITSTAASTAVLLTNNGAIVVKAGGWSAFKPLDADSEAAFKEALAKLVGVDYKPLLAAVQTVNGRNYLFAVNAKIPGGGNAYAALIRAYKAPGAPAVITGITKLGHPGFAGSYGAFESPSPEAKAALEEARRIGLDFVPAYAATQIVAGRNYLFAGNAKHVTLHASEFPAFVTVYKPLEGKAQITSVRAAYEA